MTITGTDFQFFNMASGDNPLGDFQNIRCRFSQSCSVNGPNCAVPPLLEVQPVNSSGTILICQAPQAFTVGMVDVFISFNRQQWIQVLGTPNPNRIPSL